MTIQSLSPEEKRVKIAEACGTLACPGCGWNGLECGGHSYSVPDYLNSLDAMHEAENTLNDMQLCVFRGYLFGYSTTHPIHATAAERADAFIHAIQS